MLHTIDSGRVDAETRAYLQRVKQAAGSGAAGLYIPGSQPSGIWYLLCGIVVLPLFLWIGYTSTKPAWANAMIQTAGVLLGGWMILAFLRVAILSRGKLGNFHYFDPNRVYVGVGDQFQFADLDEKTTVEPAGTNGIRFSTSEGNFYLNLPERQLAAFVADYYDAIDHLLTEEGQRFERLSTAELGAVAKYMVRHEKLPEQLREVEITIENLPDEVRTTSGLSLGFLRYPIIVAAGALAFAFFFLTNSPLQEGSAFADAKAGSPAKMRDYLLNPNHGNEEHRREIEALLKKQYDAPIAALQSRPGTDPELRDAFIALIETLRGPDTPAVSLEVRELSDELNSSWSKQLRERIADGVGTVVGKEHIVFVQKPEEKKALMEVTFSVVNTKLQYTVEFRKSPDDAKPDFTQTHVVGVPSTTMTEAVYQSLMMRMLGMAPAPPPALPPDENDW